MDLAPDSSLYEDALAAAKLAEERHEASTRSDYSGSLRRFAEFCEAAGYPNPLKHRFLDVTGCNRYMVTVPWNWYCEICS
jgi:hypothetical protein